MKQGICNFSSVPETANARIHAFCQRALNTFGATQQTYLLSRHVLEHNVPGAFVECGVAAGAQLAAMAQAMVDAGKYRDIYGYDSFEGIPWAGPRDDQQPGIGRIVVDQHLPLEERLRSSGVSGCPLNEVYKIWFGWRFPHEVNVVWRKGWFQHTLPDCRVDTIAFLRLDGDLYESTMECLTWLYHRVHAGGIVFIDDWGLKGCQDAVHDFLRDWTTHYKEKMPEFLFDPNLKEGGDSIYWIR